MFKLILDYDFLKPKPAIDTSRFLHHGRIINALHNSDGKSIGTGSLEFLSSDSAVRIPTGHAWNNLHALTIECYVKVKKLGQRQNIIEGDNSFALFIESDGSIVASFLGFVQGQTSLQWNWVSTSIHSNSIPILIQKNIWTKISFVFDGFGRAMIWINGNLSGIRSDFTSGIKSVESAGIVLGNWTLRNQYALNGEIDSIRVWKYDQDAIIRQFVSRLKNQDERYTWERFIDCLISSRGKNEEQYHLFIIYFMKILDKIIRNIYNNSPEQNKLLAELLNKYLLTWKSNCITSQSHIDNAIKLREIFESFEDIDLNKETIELINLLPDLFEDKRNLCFWNSNIKNTDSEFVEFIEKLSSKIHY